MKFALIVVLTSAAPSALLARESAATVRVIVVVAPEVDLAPDCLPPALTTLPHPFACGRIHL